MHANKLATLQKGIEANLPAVDSSRMYGKH